MIMVADKNVTHCYKAYVPGSSRITMQFMTNETIIIVEQQKIEFLGNVSNHALPVT